MFEKVNPAHPDKIADRIAGAIVDLAYNENANPKIAVEVLIGHGMCNIAAESSVHISATDILEAVSRIAGDVVVNYHEVAQDPILARNQANAVRCGDNGIFRGVPVTDEQRALAEIAREIFARYPSDEYLQDQFPGAEINPLGDWTGGIDVDTGATNRKLGSDMADSITGGGLHGKDLSKADVSVNIYAWLKAQRDEVPVELCCAIGDDTVDGRPYAEIVRIARDYIRRIGGFEKFAEWGLV